ncbi:MAG: hypothetical protein CMD92_09070 [Gammaproteobacteria bacterium]|nr:hypothetical protein [Gammaproteobacteria bacterium]HBW84878.1 hypothetical protein [Gammaproteobacteria bacterium]|tara:strand:- start:478 stop:1842 length:1365 start_codon:yes stop_codon:yes gene_type:complete
MKKLNKISLTILLTGLVIPFGLSGLVSAGEDEQRAPPEARTSGTLSQQVMRAITEIQELMSPEDPEDEPDFAEAKIQLDDLRERRYDRMNDFEKSTLLSFYTNYYLGIEDYLGAIGIFEETLTIEELRADVRLRTLRSLGQLYAAEENWAKSIENYQAWRQLSSVEDVVVFKGLSYAYYQQEQYAEALPFWLDYMNLSLVEGEELGRDDYAYLNGIYFVLEDFENALDLTKTMIVKFNDATDWLNLNAVYASLDMEERRVQALNLAYLNGVVDDEARYLNLGQSLAGMDIPLTGSEIIEEGLQEGIIERNEDNLQISAQLFLIASDYASALPSALELAEISDSGDAWDSVGYIHYVMANYSDSADAFRSAIDKGNLSNRSDTLIFLARALLELDDFEGARSAARQAADAGDEEDRESANQYLTFIGNSEQRFNIIEQRKQEAIDFYEPYPSLLD